MQMQRKQDLDVGRDARPSSNENNNAMNNEFYNDDLYDYKDYFMGSRKNEEDDEDLGDEDDELGPLAINNIGNRGAAAATTTTINEYYDNTDDFDIDAQFNEDDEDDMIMDTFFKKVDSMELVKPKKAKIIADYLFGELLGDGSYGKVKECLDTRNLCRRAVKIINLKTVSRKIPKGIQNVRKEINVMKRLSHRNLIRLYDVFEKNPSSLDSEKLKPANKHQRVNPMTGIPIPETSNEMDGVPNMTLEKPPKLYIFMDYCMTSLEKLLKCAPNERLCNWQANFYFKQLIDGLEYLHSIGIIHNDIKPGNLLITCDDTLKICDFSISVEINLFRDYEYTSDNVNTDDTNGYNDLLNINEHANPKKFPIVQCTPMFQCPEMLAESLNEKQIIHNAAKIDIWSTGVSLYQLTTGTLPFNGQTVHQIYENIRSNSYPIVLPEVLDKNLQKLLRGMLNRDPLQRWSIQQIREAEWFKKKHPCLREELAQWPVDVLQNETGTFRMIQYLEKLCENNNSDQGNMTRTMTQSNITNSQNNYNYYDENEVELNSQNSKRNATTKPNHSNNSTNKAYGQATKVKRNNCSIN